MSAPTLRDLCGEKGFMPCPFYLAAALVQWTTPVNFDIPIDSIKTAIIFNQCLGKLCPMWRIESREIYEYKGDKMVSMKGIGWCGLAGGIP